MPSKILKSVLFIILIVIFDRSLIRVEASAVSELKLSPLVSLPSGQGILQGKSQLSRGGRKFWAFLGVPFALPPQRFKNPLPPLPWEGTRQSITFGSECFQQSFVTGGGSGSEDCLFVNVFTPNLSPSELLPTIVFVHGGGFVGGSGGQSGPDYFMDEDVLYVTFNYRLGPFGFLNVQDESSGADGNVGLKDQTEAFKWIKRNIKAFGGNPELITIFGGSAGAASVNLHLMSPMSKGLFKHAISGSGSAECPWAIIPNPKENAKKLASLLNCPVDKTTEEMVNCMRNKDPNEFIGKKITKSGWTLDPIAPFAPSVETSTGGKDIFLPDFPQNLLAKRKFHKEVPWLTGLTRNEGLALHSAAISSNATLLLELSSKWSTYAPITLTLDNTFSPEKLPEVVEKIRSFYFGPDGIITPESLERLYTYRNFFHGVRSTIRRQVGSGGKVFAYIFDYKGTPSWIETMYGFNTSGVAHGDDLNYYNKFYMDPNNPASGFGLPPKAPNSPAEEMSKKLVKFIVHFAINGDPDNFLGVKWPPVSKSEVSGATPLKWFHIDVNPSLQEESPDLQSRMDFWTALLSSFNPSSV